MRIGDLPDKITESFSSLVPDLYYSSGNNNCNPLRKYAVNTSIDEYSGKINGLSRDNVNGTTYTNFDRNFFPLYTTEKEMIEHYFNRKKISYSYNLDFTWKNRFRDEPTNINSNSTFNIWLLKGQSEFTNPAITEADADHILPYERCCKEWEAEVNGTRYSFRNKWKDFNLDAESRYNLNIAGEEVDLQMVELYEDMEYIYNNELYYYEPIYSNYLGIYCSVSSFIGHNFSRAGIGFWGYRDGVNYYSSNTDRLTDLEINIMGKTFLGYVHTDKGNYEGSLSGKVSLTWEFWEYDIN